MDLLVVRHAIAEERESFAATGEDDSKRPLTASGRRRFEKGAAGLARLVKRVDLLATSHLVRAVETGDILEKALEVGRTTRLRQLDPAAEPAALLEWLGGHRAVGCLAAIGHEPHLSSFVAYAVCRNPACSLELKKGGACLLTFEGEPAPGGAALRWLLTAGQLRRLA